MQSPRATLLCQFHYDAQDQLIANTLPNRPEHQRFYCKSRLTTEIQGATRYSIVQHGDQLLAQQQSKGAALDILLLATDQQRSVLAAPKANQPLQPIMFTPYGHQPALTGLLSLLGFNGEHPDPVTGWYLLGNGYRPFSPVLMRFVSPDSLSPFNNGGFNAYSYCNGDPISRRDPTGHFFVKTIPALTRHYMTIKTTIFTTKNTYRNTLPATITEYSLRTPTFPPTAAPATTSAPATLQDLAFRVMGAEKAGQLVNKGELPQRLFNEQYMRNVHTLSEIIEYRTALLTTSKTYQKNNVKIETYMEGLRGEIPGITKQETITSLKSDAERNTFLESVFPEHFPKRYYGSDLSGVIRKGY